VSIVPSAGSRTEAYAASAARANWMTLGGVLVDALENGG